MSEYTKFVIFDKNKPDEALGFVTLKEGVYITEQEQIQLHFKDGQLDYLTFEPTTEPAPEKKKIDISAIAKFFGKKE